MIPRRTRLALGALLLAAAAVVLAAAPSAPAARAATQTVAIDHNFYDPAVITVDAGDTVQWAWPAAPNQIPHSVTSDTGSELQSATQATGTYSKTFDTPGTYAYHCVVHPDEMTGTVIVQAAPTATPTATAPATKTPASPSPTRTSTPEPTSTPVPAATLIAVPTAAPPQPSAPALIAPSSPSGGAAGAGALPRAGDGPGGAAPWRSAAVVLAALGAIALVGARMVRKRA